MGVGKEVPVLKRPPGRGTARKAFRGSPPALGGGPVGGGGAGADGCPPLATTGVAVERTINKT